MATKSNNAKVNVVLENNVFNAAFKTVGTEATTLNATLRNIAALAPINKDVKQIADWLGVKASNVSGKALTELRNSIIAELVFFIRDENDIITPCNVYKCATVGNTNYYNVRQISWLAALKMICTRKNKCLDSKHTELNADAIYNTACDVVSDTNTLDKVQKCIDDAKALSELNKQRRNIATSGDADAIRQLADEVARETAK